MNAGMTPRQRSAVSRIVGLTLINAMVFQEILALSHPRVTTLRQSLRHPDVATQLANHWQFIIDHINYVPIFKIGRDLLQAMPASADLDNALRFAAQQALAIVSQRAALRHDLMGRVYHRLLVEAKYLGTYYTSVPAATLLLKLALAPDRWKLAWDKLDTFSNFRVADIACGTGTLLMAAAEAITDNHVRASAARRRPPDLRGLHRRLMDAVIYGYDVLPSAVHLTASTLALRAADVAFRAMHLWSLPLGIYSLGTPLSSGSVATAGTPSRGRARSISPTRHHMGSIDFLASREIRGIADMFGAVVSPGQVTEAALAPDVVASLPDLDLCVMNPPFTRSVGGNLLFGSLPDQERRQLQRHLSQFLQRHKAEASSTAGLGSVFVAVADRYVKEGGRMALVLPKALLSGVAWEKTRNLFASKYRLEYVISSHDPSQWNFSENTDLSEVLVVAQKVGEGAASRDRSAVVCLNLWKNPTTAFEALSVARGLTSNGASDVAQGQGALEVMVGRVKMGEAVSVPWRYLRQRQWMLPAAFAQAELVRAAYHLQEGRLYLPGHGVLRQVRVPLCPLEALGTLGPDVRDIHDGFRASSTFTSYPAFWSHDAPLVGTLAQSPNNYLSPLPSAKPGRPLRRVTDLWPRAGRLLLAERLRLNTQRLAAVRLAENVLSNVWWPLALAREDAAEEKALILWLNSTLGLLLLLAHRVETEGAWVKFRKPILAALPVLDVRRLSVRRKQALSSAYDLLCRQPLLPFPEMAHDPVRQAIDEAVASALGLPDLSPLRELLAREPVVCLQPL